MCAPSCHIELRMGVVDAETLTQWVVGYDQRGNARNEINLDVCVLIFDGAVVLDARFLVFLI